MQQRYRLALERAISVQGDLRRKEAELLREGSELPQDVRSARGRLVVEERTVMIAVGKNDIVQGNESLQVLEETLGRIPRDCR